MEEKGLGAGTPTGGTKPPMPRDVELVYKTAGYELYFSEATKQVIIQTREYHAGDLYLDAPDLEELLRKIS